MVWQERQQFRDYRLNIVLELNIDNDEFVVKLRSKMREKREHEN